MDFEELTDKLLFFKLQKDHIRVSPGLPVTYLNIEIIQ